jgi:L-threonylcarbamoyladenylate synthase
LKRTLVCKVNPQRPDRTVIARSAKVLRSGGLVAFPTETVYGLAANLSKKAGMDALYRVKERPKGKPSTVHIADTRIIRKMGCAISRDARILIDKFWPGPLTVILASKKGAKIGFRMPDNKVALALIREAGVPIVAPSANLSGKTPPKSASDVLRDLDGRIDIVIDAGKTKVGIESTVIDMTQCPPAILREGAIKKRAILRLLKYE